MPRVASASSSASDWLLVRYSTAISRGGNALRGERLDARGHALRLRDVVVIRGVRGRGAIGPLRTSSTELNAPPRARVSALASATTCGVER